MSFNALLSPIQIKGLNLKNRVVFPAMGTKMPTKDKFCTQQIIDYHVARVKGGCGLNMSEVCSVYAPASPEKFLSIAEDKFVPDLKKLTDAIHQAGGKAGIQLWLGGLAVAADSQAMIIIPSDMPVAGTDYSIPGVSMDVLKESIQAFGDAARRAVEAGFDTVEFHAAHNYVPHSFLSPFFNQRTDEYGGSLENRARFSLECIKAIRENIPEEMPIFMRVGAQDDYLEGGLSIDDIIAFCKMAEVAGVDVLDVSRGNFSSNAIKYEVPPIDLPRGFNVENAAKIRKETGMLTIAVGRINDPDQAEEILESGKADMVVMGRAQLADPEFVNKVKEGRIDEIVKCVGCNQGCYDGFVSPEMPFITCMRNPALGREAEYNLVPTDAPKKILIAGGGLAGLEAAKVLKCRGHEPVVYEASDHLGGQFILAGEAPRKEEMKAAAISAGEQVKKAGVEIKFNSLVDVEAIKAENPDAVIIAVGAEPAKLSVSNADLQVVVSSHDVLSGKAQVCGRVVVIGGGLVGLEVAEYLHGQGSDVTVVEMLDQVAKDLGDLRKICVMENLSEFGIKTLTQAKCMEIREKSVVVDQDGDLAEILCDAVVVAIGSKPWDFCEIKNYCEANNINVHVAGDALRARRALNAVAEANEIARSI